MNRRAFLQSGSVSLGTIALNSLLSGCNESLHTPSVTPSVTASESPKPKQAKHVIYLNMVGGPSPMDLFDPKPTLAKFNDSSPPDDLIGNERFAFIDSTARIKASPFKFSRHGSAGHWMCEKLPHMSKVADDLSFIKSLHTEEFNHGPAQVFLQTGHGQLGRPSIGSWVSYGLGNEVDNLPTYMVLLTGSIPGGGSSLWGSGFLPSNHQGTQLRSEGEPILYVNDPPGRDRDTTKRTVDAIAALNRMAYEKRGDPEILARTENYELAFEMQASVPELVDFSGETRQTFQLYGIKNKNKPSFARSALLARRMVERGVRFVEIFDDRWDNHENIEQYLTTKCRETDQGCAALILDLKQRGLLDETLVIWGGEFGRTPMSQHNPGMKWGRDHNPRCFTMWMAGGGVKPGVSYGESDDFGYNVASDPVHVHDLNATILHLLGIDHKQLTYKYQGREFRLTDTGGKIVDAACS